jgi:Flp pilus assembly protein TadD
MSNTQSKIVNLRGAKSLLACALLLAACASQNSQDGSEGQANDGRAFDLGTNKNPSAKTLHAMARVMASQGRDAEGEIVLERLIHDYPHFLPAYNELAELHNRQNNYDSAAEALRAGLEVAPKDPVLLNNLGMCYALEHRFEDALKTFTDAAACAPEDVRPRANMAFALGMLGRMDEARSLYEQVVPPQDAHYNLAVIYEARKDPQSAAREFALADEIASGGKKK